MSELVTGEREEVSSPGPVEPEVLASRRTSRTELSGIADGFTGRGGTQRPGLWPHLGAAHP